ncbi:MAG TPA: class I SAM-dependent methyltransferase [Chloroflexota bacterium]|nr:class I SAM-dependent methyltransferase [Chloroflexota bacterium]
MSIQQFENPYQPVIAAKLYDRLAEPRRDVELYVMLAQEAGGPILELGCGTGRCLIPLIRAGFDVVGVDSSEAMLDRLRARLQMEPEEVRRRASELHGDGRSISLPLTFGMAFMALNSFCLVTTKEDQLDLLENMYHHIRPGGFLVIDVFNPDPERIAREDEVVKRTGDYEVVERAERSDLAMQTRPVVTTYKQGGTTLATLSWTMRYTYRFELEHLVERAGFRIMHLWGDYERRAFGDATDRLFLVARKPDDEPDAVIEQAVTVAVDAVGGLTDG